LPHPTHAGRREIFIMPFSHGRRAEPSPSFVRAARPPQRQPVLPQPPRRKQAAARSYQGIPAARQRPPGC